MIILNQIIRRKLFILKQGITGQSYDANFNDDFDAFVYFAYSSLNQQKKAPKFPINALLQPRTQELYKYLLKCRYQELLQKQNIL